MKNKAIKPVKAWALIHELHQYKIDVDLICTDHFRVEKWPNATGGLG